jgi:hypothetical protein
VYSSRPNTESLGSSLKIVHIECSLVSTVGWCFYGWATLFTPQIGMTPLASKLFKSKVPGPIFTCELAQAVDQAIKEVWWEVDPMQDWSRIAIMIAAHRVRCWVPRSSLRCEAEGMLVTFCVRRVLDAVAGTKYVRLCGYHWIPLGSSGLPTRPESGGARISTFAQL